MSTPGGLGPGSSDFSFYTNGNQPSPSPNMAPGVGNPGLKLSQIQAEGQLSSHAPFENGHSASLASQVFKDHSMSASNRFLQEPPRLMPLQAHQRTPDPRLIPNSHGAPSHSAYQSAPISRLSPQIASSLVSQIQQASTSQNLSSRQMVTPVHHGMDQIPPFNSYPNFRTPLGGNPNGYVTGPANRTGMPPSSRAWGVQPHLQSRANYIGQGKGSALNQGVVVSSAEYLSSLGGGQYTHNSTPVQGERLLVNGMLPNHQQAGKTGTKRRSIQPTSSRTAKKRKGIVSQILGSPSLQDSQQVQNDKAKAMLSGMQSRVGPIFTAQAQLDANSVRRIIMSLLSGVPAAVNMALNALSLLSFHGTPLPLVEQTKIVTALCRVIDRCLNKRDPPMLLLPRKPPELEQRFWWEDEAEGLLSQSEHCTDEVMWAVCTSNVLRNMTIAGKPGQMGNFASVGSRVVKCLEKRDSAHVWNEMALNMMEMVQGMGGKVDPVGEKGDCKPLVEALLKLLSERSAPLRLRTASAGAFGSLVGSVNHRDAAFQVVSSLEETLRNGIRSLLQCSNEVARKCADDEAEGEMGFVDLILPEPMKDFEKDLLAWRLQSDAISAGAKICECLCQLREPDSGELLSKFTSTIRCLVKLSTGQSTIQLLSSRGSLQASQHPFAICARNALRRAERTAINIVSHLASSREYCYCLKPYEFDLVEVAFSNAPHSPLMSRILALIQKNCPMERESPPEDS